MWRFLVALGFLLALAGLVIMALGVAIFVSSFGNTLIATGAVSLSGGIVIIAVALVLKELRELSGRLDAVLAVGTLPASRAPAFPAAERATDLMVEDEDGMVEEDIEPELPAEAPPRAFPPPPSFPRPRGAERPVAPPAFEPAAPLPEALKRGRVLGRAPEGEAFTSRMRPLDAPAPEANEPEPAPLPPRAFTPPARQPEPPAPPAAPEPSVLKSGIVGGMAYTLYSDGSIQAELPDGTLRFASLQELRDHVARSSHPQ
ncbi:hypothetical protein ABLE91_18900 [Aquabacter sp. CN5-332]|uniref:hypothetical protein n=1 Tax=Aquabacter sp. CN5-332 TaxID=3156608 RepID=UPI0032B61DB6